LVIFTTLCAVALSGCLRTEVTLDVVSSERTDVSLLVALDVEVLTSFATEFGDKEQAEALMAMSGEQLVAELAEGEDPCSGVVGGLEFERAEYSQGNYRGVICTARGVDTKEVMTELFGDPRAIQENTADGGWVLAARLSNAMGLESSVEEIAGFDSGEMFDVGELLEFRVSISAPGRVLNHNGTSANGARVTWVVTQDAEFVEGTDAVLRAQWVPAASGVRLLVVVLLAAVMAAVTLTLAGRTRLRP
jgi:hypothetical protein